MWEGFVCLCVLLFFLLLLKNRFVFNLLNVNNNSNDHNYWHRVLVFWVVVRAYLHMLVVHDNIPVGIRHRNRLLRSVRFVVPTHVHVGHMNSCRNELPALPHILHPHRLDTFPPWQFEHDPISIISFVWPASPYAMNQPELVNESLLSLCANKKKTEQNRNRRRSVHCEKKKIFR